MKETAARERERESEEVRMCGIFLTVCSEVGQGQLFAQEAGRFSAAHRAVM